MELGDLIKHHRQRLNLSQDELASRVGVSRQAVQQWEKGVTGPKRAVAKILAETLCIPISSIDPLMAATVSEVDFPDGARIMLYELADMILATGRPDAAALLSMAASRRTSVDPQFADCFAFEVLDVSMEPDYMLRDIVIVDPRRQPKNNDDVVVAIAGKPAIFRRFIDRGVDRYGRAVFDLVTPNADSVTITVNSDNPLTILGTAIEVRRRKGI
jgi:DNA-binding XRE family transcriptional regulator